MMRILHVISGLEPENGGPTAALVGQCRAMTAAGVACSVVSTWKFRSSFQTAEELERDGIRVTLLGPTRRPFRTHRDMDATLIAAIVAHDVVQIHAVWEWIEHRAAALARRAGKPYVWTPHGMLDEWNMRRNHWFKRACFASYLRRDLNAAAAIHVASAFEARNVARLGLVAPNYVQGFGLDGSLLTADTPRGRFRAAHGFADDTPLVLFLGRIQRGKGLEMLVPALTRMQTTAARLVVAGPDEGDYRRHIEALAAAHGVAGRITFVGMLGGETKWQALADADVLAAPSSHESFGLAVAEAIASGTPVAVSDQVGLADEITRHRLGHVAPQTIEATAAATDAALRPDADHRERAKAFARQAFAWPVIANAWKAKYEEVTRLTPRGR